MNEAPPAGLRPARWVEGRVKWVVFFLLVVGVGAGIKDAHDDAPVWTDEYKQRWAVSENTGI